MKTLIRKATKATDTKKKDVSIKSKKVAQCCAKTSKVTAGCHD